MRKKLLSLMLAGVMSIGLISETQAATRDEIMSVKVSKSGKFNYWNSDSQAKEKLVSYIKDITNKKSSNFIPIEDRIAVFDLDGTLVCETAPCYFEWMMYLDRALYDSNYTPSKEDRDIATLVESEIRAGHFASNQFPKSLDNQEAISQESVFAGMSVEDYDSYVNRFLQKNVEGLTNLKWGEAFYLPMVEVIRYLQANDFKVYIVSGSERSALRVLASDVLKIPVNQIIGTDAAILASHQGDKDGGDYVYQSNDSLIRGKLLTKNLKMNKVSIIAQEIGKQPVLAFGNSGGDASMLNYAISNNKYRSASFMILCDDVDREFGSLIKAENCKNLAESNGWIAVSMRDEFKTIYGDDVTRE